MSKALVSIICLALLFALPKPAHAYLGKLMWHRITSFLGIRRPDDADN